MGTHAVFVVKGHEHAAEDDNHFVFRHWDGYPSVIMPDLLKVLPFAWPLPRFEPDDFAAAIIRAWKEEGGGNIRTAKDEYVVSNFFYVIYPKNDQVWVEIRKSYLTAEPEWVGQLQAWTPPPKET